MNTEQIDQMLATINPEIYNRFQTAIELGKWPDGSKVDSEQMELLLQVTIAYGAKNGLNEAELFKVNANGNFQDGKKIRQQTAKVSRKTTAKEIPIKQNITDKNDSEYNKK